MEEETAMELSSTIPALLSQQVATFGSETILRKKERGIWHAVTWSELEGYVREIGQGLRAAGLTQAIQSRCCRRRGRNLPTPTLRFSAVAPPAWQSDPADEAPRVGEILRDTGATFAIVEGEEQLDKMLGVRARLSGAAADRHHRHEGSARLSRSRLLQSG